MPLDIRLPLLAGQGVSPIDPMAFQRGQQTALQLQAAQRQGQMQQLELAEAQRQEQERGTMARAFHKNVVTDPVTGETRVNIPGALTEAYRTTSDPLTVFKAQQSYEKSQAASAKDVLEARKVQLETAQERTKYVARLAHSLLATEDRGEDVQTAYQQTMQQAARDLGVAHIPGMPPTYDRSVMQQLADQGRTYDERLKSDLDRTNQQLRAAEVAETQKRTEIEREGLAIRREDVTARREETAQRREERQQQRETQGSARTFEQEDKLRNDFVAQTKPYQVQSEFYGRIETAAKDPSAAGDLALIYSFMKLLDPGSTVLAGEYATAANAGSIPERIYSQYNRLVSGELLGDEEKGTIRKDYLDRARRIYEQSTKDYQRTKAVFDERARRYHLDPANVTQDLGSTAERTAGTGTPAASAPPRVMTEADIEATIKDSVTAGRPVTRQQVIDAAKRKGWQTP
jgi:hypothetical protein